MSGKGQKDALGWWSPSLAPSQPTSPARARPEGMKYSALVCAAFHFQAFHNSSSALLPPLAFLRMEREREFFWVTRNFIRLLEPLLLPTQPNSGLAALDRGGLGVLHIPPRAALCSLPSWHVPAFHESLCEPCPEQFSDWVEPCQALPALKCSLPQSKSYSTEA